MTVVILGAHGAGKSTVGARLAARLGVPFHDEIGWRLATNRPPGRTAEHHQEDFDEAVFAAEVRRDAAWCGGTRVVETWHPGNLAYAARRSPSVVDRHLPSLVALGPAVALPIRVPPDVARARQHEPGDRAFFDTVGVDAEVWAARLGLRVLPPLWNTGSVDDAVTSALRTLEIR